MAVTCILAGSREVGASRVGSTLESPHTRAAPPAPVPSVSDGAGPCGGRPASSSQEAPRGIRTHQGNSRPGPGDALSALDPRRGEHSRRGRGDPGFQPPGGHRLLLPSAAGGPRGRLHRQGRLLHRQGRQGLGGEELHEDRGHYPRGPFRRQGLPGGAPGRHRPPALGATLRHLPRGHAQPRRAPLPRQDRRGPHRPGYRSPCGSCGDDRLQPGSADRQVHPLHPPPRGHRHRRAAGLLPLQGPGERPLRAALHHRRDHVRPHGPVRPGVRGPLRRRRQEGHGLGEEDRR